MPHPRPGSESADQLILRIGDAVHSAEGTPLGRLDRAVVTPDLRGGGITHVGIQPSQQWKWPRLVDAGQLRPGSSEHQPHTLDLQRSWPDGYPTADVIPGVAEDELPDHPIVPSSGIQQFLLAVTSSGTDSPLAVSNVMRDRVPDGETVLRRGVRLVEVDHYALHPLGEITGVVVGADRHTVDEVLVRHRHGLHHRVARFPVSNIEQAGSHQVTTSSSRRDLDRYDTSVSD